MTVNKFMLMHIGFEKPTPALMDKWKEWFASIASIQVEQGGFAAGREISAEGARELPWDKDCVTGYNIIEAESLDAAEAVARRNPFISSIRIYQLR